MSAPQHTPATPTDLSLAPPRPALAGEAPAARLRLEPTGSARTLLDGGWWPRSTDPLTELPGLVLAIDPIHGPVTRLVLNADGWDSHPRRLVVAGRVLRLGWFASQHASLLTAICLNGDRVDLLVVPPESEDDLAEGAMALAATAGNRVHAPHLLSAASTPVVRNSDSAAVDAAEAEGDHLGSDAGLTTAHRRAVASAASAMFPAHRPPPGPVPQPRRAAGGNLRDDLTREQPMKIARQKIIDALRARGQHVRADWIRQELPEHVDLTQHAGLLATLRLDPADLAEAP